MKIFKTLALVSASITLVLTICLGAFAVTSMQKIMGIIEVQGNYLSMGETHGVNIEDAEEVINFYNALNDTLAKQAFSTGNTNIIIFVSILVFNIIFALSTFIFIALIRVKNIN